MESITTYTLSNIDSSSIEIFQYMRDSIELFGPLIDGGDPIPILILLKF